MLQFYRPWDSTSNSVVVRIVDSTDQSPEVGVVAATSGLALKYTRQGGVVTAITATNLGSVNASFTGSGIIHLGDGNYRLDLADTAFASTGSPTHILVHGTVTGMFVLPTLIELGTFNPRIATNAGLTALPAVAAAAAGGLFTRGSGAGQINQQANGQIDVNLAAVLNDGANLDSFLAMLEIGIRCTVTTANYTPVAPTGTPPTQKFRVADYTEQTLNHIQRKGAWVRTGTLTRQFLGVVLSQTWVPGTSENEIIVSPGSPSLEAMGNGAKIYIA